MKMDTALTQMVLITVLVILDTQAMEFHVLVRNIIHTKYSIPHGCKNVVRLLPYDIV